MLINVHWKRENNQCCRFQSKWKTVQGLVLARPAAGHPGSLLLNSFATNDLDGMRWSAMAMKKWWWSWCSKSILELEFRRWHECQRWYISAMEWVTCTLKQENPLCCRYRYKVLSCGNDVWVSGWILSYSCTRYTRLLRHLWRDCTCCGIGKCKERKNWL